MTAKKLFVSLTLVASLAAPVFALADHTPSHTIEQLQAQIAALQAQINALSQQQTRTPPPSSSALQNNDSVRATTILKIRSAAGLSGTAIAKASAGDTGVIRCDLLFSGSACPVMVDGLRWWYVDWDNPFLPNGWSAEATSEGPFLIKNTPATTQPPSLSISYISGNKNVYAPGEKILLVMKGIELPDNTPGTPDEGYNVQVHLRGANASYAAQGVNATYNPQNGYWDAQLVAPTDNSTYYIVESAFYCSNKSLICGKKFSSGPTDDKGQSTASFSFTIGVSAAVGQKPSITVLSPNGGEVWRAGETREIKFKVAGDGQVGYVSISVFRSTPIVFNDNFNNQTLPAGEYKSLWKIPEDISPSEEYEVQAVLYKTPAGVGMPAVLTKDFSDAPFKIEAPPTNVPVTADLKVNDSDSPSVIPYSSSFTASWTSTGASGCSAYGHHVPLSGISGGGLWTDLTDLPASGSRTLIARHNTYGYITPLQLSILCERIGSGGEMARDTVYIPVFQEQPTAVQISTGGQISQNLHYVQSSNSFYGIGSDNAVWKWDNSAKQWSRITDGSVKDDFHFISESDIYAIGLDNQIWHWNGIRWNQESTGGKIQQKIWYVDGNHIYGIGMDNQVWRYGSAGGWTKITANGQIKDDFHFISESDIYGIGLDGQIWRWNGTSWNQHSSGGAIKQKLHFISSSNIWGIGLDDKIWGWNGGVWSALHSSGQTKDDFVVVFGDRSIAYGIGLDGQIWKFSFAMGNAPSEKAFASLPQESPAIRTNPEQQLANVLVSIQTQLNEIAKKIKAFMLERFGQ